MQPTRQQILAETARVREGVQTHRHTDFARHTLRIPLEDMHALRMLYPGLGAKDPLERAAALEAFERSPFAEPYRVGKIVRGIVKNGAITK